MGSKGTTKNKGRKDELDRFYTEPSVAAALVRALLEEHPDWVETKHFVEPSAGDGAFVSALESAGATHIHALDIAPAETPLCETEIVQHDFLADDLIGKVPELSGVARDDIVFLGNPPFGEQASLAIAFVKRSMEIGGVCAFILPPSFYKESVQKKFKDLGAVDDIKNIDNIAYRLVGAGHVQVPSSFFVFRSGKAFVPEPDRSGELPFSFIPKKSKSDADFAIRRVGGTAGTATSDVMSVSEESYYYCKKKPECPDDIIDRINACEFPERDWSVGPRSLSQKEIAKNIYAQVVCFLDENSCFA